MQTAIEMTEDGSWSGREKVKRFNGKAPIANKIQWQSGSKVILAAIESQVPFAEQLRVQAAKSLTDTDAL